MPEIDQSPLALRLAETSEAADKYLDKAAKYPLSVAQFRTLAAARYRWLSLSHGFDILMTIEMPRGYGRRAIVPITAARKVLDNDLITDERFPSLTDFGKRVYNGYLERGWRLRVAVGEKPSVYMSPAESAA